MNKCNLCNERSDRFCTICWKDFCMDHTSEHEIATCINQVIKQKANLK